MFIKQKTNKQAKKLKQTSHVKTKKTKNKKTNKNNNNKTCKISMVNKIMGGKTYFMKMRKTTTKTRTADSSVMASQRWSTCEYEK